MIKKTTPHPVDIHVGQALRIQRTLAGMSQTEVADKLGLTFQQIQKYERGMNRISASKLFELSQILEVHVYYFFAGLKQNNSSMLVDNGGEVKEIYSREVLELVRTYLKMPTTMQKSILDLIRKISKMKGASK